MSTNEVNKTISPKRRYVCGVLTKKAELPYVDEWNQEAILPVTLIGTWVYPLDETQPSQAGFDEFHDHRVTIAVVPDGLAPVTASKTQISHTPVLQQFAWAVQASALASYHKRKHSQVFSKPVYYIAEEDRIDYSGKG